MFLFRLQDIHNSHLFSSRLNKFTYCSVTIIKRGLREEGLHSNFLIKYRDGAGIVSVTCGLSFGMASARCDE